MDEITREKLMDDLLKMRVIYLDGEVTQSMSKRIGSSILWLNAIDDSKEITLYINSSGGSVSAGLDIYDIIRHSKAPVTGIVFRCANSMASIILQGCKIRKALKHCQIILHNIKAEQEWHKFEEDLEKALHDTKKDQQAMYDILAERTNRNMKEIKKVCKESKEFRSEEAKEFGLIDEII